MRPYGRAIADKLSYWPWLNAHPCSRDVQAASRRWQPLAGPSHTPDGPCIVHKAGRHAAECLGHGHLAIPRVVRWNLAPLHLSTDQGGRFASYPEAVKEALTE